jgi:Fe-Mn family superoxide dismutase
MINKDKTFNIDLDKLARKTVKEVLQKNGLLSESPKKTDSSVIKEAQVVTPDSFVIKTEKLSMRTKESHVNLYRDYIDKFNKTSSKLDTANKHEAGNNNSDYRSLKIDECYNLNAIKLHELYFDNISDLASEIAVDSLPYIKFSRDFGNFENWQFDFIACALSAREGWVVTVYEPYKNVYMNVCVDGHAVGIPLGSIPVLALDMWSHSYYRDYESDKKPYIVAMMKEINWDVVEARMTVAEKSDLNAIYAIKPIYNNNPEKILNSVPDTNAPIDKVYSGAYDKQVSPSSPAMPNTIDQMMGNRSFQKQ